MDSQLEEMRQQMAILKQKLEQQEIVNDRIIRHSMKKAVRSIGNYYVFNICACVFVIILSYFIFTVKGFSLAFCCATCILMLLGIATSIYNKVILKDSVIMSANMLEVRKNMLRAKKADTKIFLFGMIGSVLWYVWLQYEALQKFGTSSMQLFIFFFIGCILSVILYKGVQRKYHEVLDQIEELEE